MVKLTRLNGQRIALNSDSILWAEEAPDTTLRLVNGESVIVRETIEELIEQVIAFRVRVATSVVPSRADASAVD